MLDPYIEMRPELLKGRQERDPRRSKEDPIAPLPIPTSIHVYKRLFVLVTHYAMELLRFTSTRVGTASCRCFRADLHDRESVFRFLVEKEAWDRGEEEEVGKGDAPTVSGPERFLHRYISPDMGAGKSELALFLLSGVLPKIFQGMAKVVGEVVKKKG